MGPVTKEKLAGNAFRTLGLSGSAGQSAIELAARRMRIWPDPSRVPPTPWDLPSLGPIRRSKSDVDQAIALLNQPASRLEHRMLWFCGDRPPAVVALGTAAPAVPVPITAAGSPASVADRHADAIAGLFAAWGRADGGEGWSAVIRRIVDVCALTDLLAWFLELEQSGQFDKRASIEEIGDLLAAVPAAVAAGVIQRAMTALNDGRIEVVTSIASAVKLAPAPPGAPSPIRDLLDRMEDFCNARCSEMEKDLRDHLATNRQSPAPFFAANLEVSTRANDFYLQSVLPALSAFLKLAADDTDRRMRLQTRCGELLVLLALGWEWAGRYVLAEQQLQNALKVAQGTVTELEVRRELDRVRVLADAEREEEARAHAPGVYQQASQSGTIVNCPVIKSSPPTVKRPRPQPANKQGWRVGVGLVAGVLWIIRLIVATSDVSTPTDTRNPPHWLPRINVPTPTPAVEPAVPAVPTPDSVGRPMPADEPKKSVGDSFREP